MHLPPPTKNDLEHSVAPRRVSVSWRLARSPEGTEKTCMHLKIGGKVLWTIFIRLQLLLLFYLQLFPTSMSLRTSSVHFTSLSCRPTTCTCCLPSSRTRNLALRLSRSNTFKYKQSDSVFQTDIYTALLWQSGILDISYPKTPDW